MIYFTLLKCSNNLKPSSHLHKLVLHHRLHREALKQSATDPLSGKIDVSILTTGLSSAARKKRVELAQALRKLIQAKGRVHTLNFQKLFQEMKESSDLVGRKESLVGMC